MLKKVFTLIIFILIVLAPVASFAAVTVDIIQPSAGSYQGQTLNVVVTVSSVYEINSVEASVEGRSVSLVYTQEAYQVGFMGVWSPGWIGTIDLDGLSEGPNTLSVTATDANGGTGSSTEDFIYDKKPVISITSPLEDSVATPSIRIKASCTDTAYAGCQSITLSVESLGQLTSGTTGIDTDVSLIKKVGNEVSLQFEATDSDGQKSTLTRHVYVVESKRLSRVADLPGDVFDYGADGRVLFLDPSNGINALKIKDTLQDTTTVVLDEAGESPQSGFLSPDGAIYTESVSNNNGSNGINLYDFRNGTTEFLGGVVDPTEFKMAGDYFGWDGESIYLRDLLSGTTYEVYNNSGAIPTVGPSDLAANGDTVYATTSDFDANIYRYRSGVTTKITNDLGSVSALSWYMNSSPKTDGINIAYIKTESDSGYSSLYLYTNSQEVQLVPFMAPLLTDQNIDFQFHYELDNGWTAYTRPGSTNQAQVWLRAPDGSTEQVTFFSTSSSILAISPNGELFIKCGNKIYFYSQSQGLTETSLSLFNPPIPFLYLNNKWYTIIGRSVFAIDTSLNTSSSNSPPVVIISMPKISGSLTVPIATFPATDNSGVTGYMLTGDSTAPLADDDGWSTTAPTSYTFPDYGTYTLYLWTKDAEGNVSGPALAVTTIDKSYFPWELFYPAFIKKK